MAVNNMQTQNIYIIFILSSIGLIVSLIDNPAAKSTGNTLIVVTQTIWLIILSTFVTENNNPVLKYMNISLALYQIICILYIITSVKLGDEAENYPQEYRNYTYIAQGMVIVMFLIQIRLGYFLLEDNNKKYQGFAEFFLAILNAIFLGITVSRLKMFNNYFVITDG